MKRKVGGVSRMSEEKRVGLSRIGEKEGEEGLIIGCETKQGE